MRNFATKIRSGGFTWTLLGVGARAAGQWLIIWLLVRMFGPEEVGRYGLASAWVVPIITFSSLNLVRYQATDYNAEYSFWDYRSLRLVTSIAALIFIGATVALFPPDARALIGALSFQLLVISIIEIYLGRLVQLGQTTAYGRSLLKINLATWTSAAIVLSLFRSTEGAFIASAIASVCVFLWLIRSRYSVEFISETGSAERQSMASKLLRSRKLMWATLPLGIGLLVDSALTQTPRLILRGESNDYDLGILVGLLTFLSIGALFIESVTQVATPKISKMIARGDYSILISRLRWVTMLILLSSIVLTLPAYFIGPYIVSAILSPEYGEYPYALSGIVCIFAFQFSFRFFVIVLTALRKIQRILWINLVSLAVVILCGWILIPRFGVEGAVFSLVLANGARWILILSLLIRSFELWPFIRESKASVT